MTISSLQESFQLRDNLAKSRRCVPKGIHQHAIQKGLYLRRVDFKGRMEGEPSCGPFSVT